MSNSDPVEQLRATLDLLHDHTERVERERDEARRERDQLRAERVSTIATLRDQIELLRIELAGASLRAFAPSFRPVAGACA